MNAFILSSKSAYIGISVRKMWYFRNCHFLSDRINTKNPNLITFDSDIVLGVIYLFRKRTTPHFRMKPHIKTKIDAKNWKKVGKSGFLLLAGLQVGPCQGLRTAMMGAMDSSDLNRVDFDQII